MSSRAAKLIAAITTTILRYFIFFFLVYFLDFSLPCFISRRGQDAHAY